MLISQTTEPFMHKHDIVEVLQEFKNAGFDAYDFSFCAYDSDEALIKDDDYLQKAKKIREIADKIGIICNQAHAPFPFVYPEDEAKSERLTMLVNRSIECAAILGAKVIVVHPYNYYRAKENIALLKSFLPTLKRCHIKIGVENMWNWIEGDEHCSDAACLSIDDYVKTMKGLNPKYYTANVDIGHAEMVEKGYSYSLIKALGKYVGALHIHDNNCCRDYHLTPFTCDIDFSLPIKALKEINYQGDVTLEVMNIGDAKNMKEALTQQAKAASKIKEMILNG